MTEFQDIFQTIQEGKPNTPDTCSDSFPGAPENPGKPPDSYHEKIRPIFALITQIRAETMADIDPQCPSGSG